jgi:hypothetical protein
MMGFKIPFGVYVHCTDEDIKRATVTHKKKGRTMWIKTENGDELINMSEMGHVTIRKHDDSYVIGLPGGFSFTTIKKFKYKEDAEKYLSEFLKELNDEC